MCVCVCVCVYIVSDYFCVVGLMRVTGKEAQGDRDDGAVAGDAGALMRE